jgi:hypothetical protein
VVGQDGLSRRIHHDCDGRELDGNETYSLAVANAGLVFTKASSAAAAVHNELYMVITNIRPAANLVFNNA